MRKINDYTPLNIVERSNSRISMISSVLVLILLVLFLNVLDSNIVGSTGSGKGSRAGGQALQEEEESLPVVSTASVIAVGDNLYHDSLLAMGQSETGEWNYEKIYANVKDEIQAADLAIVDQETVLTTEHDAISGYPSFATPTEVGDALVNVGFDVVEHATNHIDDYSYYYIEQTLDFWKTKHPEITYLGIHDSQADADAVKVREVNGIRIAFLDYTYGTNNFGAGEGREYMIDMLSAGEQRVGEMIRRAKEQADCVIFIAHWGTEDEPMPSEYEKQWANFLMKQGVDVCIGGHPHVLQPYGHLTDSEGHDMVLFYSLGNFVSGQREMPELLGGMGCFTIEKTESPDGTVSVRILDPTVKPMVMHYNMDEGIACPYMLEDYTEELASQHSVKQYVGDVFTLQNLKRKFDEILSINVRPSTGTNLLNVTYTWDGYLTDPSGNYVEDTESVTEYQYYGALGINISDYSTPQTIDHTQGYTIVQ